MSSTPAPRSILVLGAGELGLPVLRHLAHLAPTQPHQPVTLSVLLRPSTLTHPSTPAKAHDLALLRALGVTALGGDVVAMAAAELVQLFRAFDAVVDCGGYARPRGGQLKVARAVLAAGVPRYVPWQFGVDYDVIGRGSGQDLFDEQCDLRALLRAQQGGGGTRWVVVSTGMFISFLFESWFGVVEPEGMKDQEEEEEGRGVGKGRWVVRALGGWDNRVTVTGPEDIGRLTARVVFDDGVEDRVVYTAGETVSYARLADIVEEVTGEKVRREVWDVGFLERELAKDPEDVVKKYRLVFAKGKGLSWPMADTINHAWEMELEDVKSWATTKWKR